MSDGWRTAPTRITLVVGPPAAGKSSHVNKHRQPGDLVIDFDRIAEALGSTDTHNHADQYVEAAQTARSAVIRRLERGRLGAGHVWLISANPHAERQFPHHNVVTVDPGHAEVIRRATAAGRPPEWLRLVDDWYERRDTPPPERTPHRHRTPPKLPRLASGPWERIRTRIKAEQTHCGLCGSPIDPTLRFPHPWSFTVDHIIPRAAGGAPYDPANLQAAHLRCNQRKGDRATRTPTPTTYSREW